MLLRGCAVRLPDGLTGVVSSIDGSMAIVEPWSKAGASQPVPEARTVVRSASV